MVNSCQAGKQERISAGKTRTCLRPGAKNAGKHGHGQFSVNVYQVQRTGD